MASISESVIAPEIATTTHPPRGRMLDVVREDLRAYQRNADGRRTSVIEMVGKLLFKPGLQSVLLYRLSRWLVLHRMRPMAMVVRHLNSVLTGAEISPDAAIGKGFTIYHPRGTSIGPAIIGDYCELFHSITIGSTHGSGEGSGSDGEPRIGDYFFGGAGARILGGITIGDHVRVGANAVVIRSLPDRVTAGGPSARIILDAESSVPAQTATPPPCSLDAVRARLVQLLTSEVGVTRLVDPIDDRTELIGRGIGMDSIDALRLAAAIEEEFQLTIDDDLSIQMSTVGSLVAFIAGRLRNDESHHLV